jgi:hypothetical protein
MVFRGHTEAWEVTLAHEQALLTEVRGTNSISFSQSSEITSAWSDCLRYRSFIEATRFVALRSVATLVSRWEWRRGNSPQLEAGHLIAGCPAFLGVEQHGREQT